MIANPNHRLSTHFTLQEMVASATADRHGIDNWPTDPDLLIKLALVCGNILEPVREHYGIPFKPNSGYRCPILNAKVGSKPTSQHPKAEAVDFEVPGISNVDLAWWCKRNLEFDQLILEFFTPGVPASGWVHCSYIQGTRRGEVLTIQKGVGNVLGLPSKNGQGYIV